MYGNELINELKNEIARNRAIISDRFDRINKGWTDMDDCFVSQKFDERAISLAQDKIKLLEDGGFAWFTEYATMDGTLVDARWVSTRYGSKLRVIMPDGSVVWTNALTDKGLAKRGIKRVSCKRPAWYKFHSGGSGMLGAYTGRYVLFPSEINYATGEPAGEAPVEVADLTE